MKKMVKQKKDSIEIQKNKGDALFALQHIVSMILLALNMILWMYVFTIFLETPSIKGFPILITLLWWGITLIITPIYLGKIAISARDRRW